MTPYYDHDGITIYHGDCRDVLPLLEPVDLVLTDPPYGIGANKQTLGTGRKKFSRGDDWDANRVEWLPELLEKGQHVCIWGGNYYADCLPATNDWLVWHKDNDGLSFSEVELAWTNFGKQARHLTHHWGGEVKQHPTQKPLPVMRWCLSYLPDANTVLDPFMGSGTTLVAAKREGRRAIGIEIEERYCEIAANRLRQGVLFGVDNQRVGVSDRET